MGNRSRPFGAAILFVGLAAAGAAGQVDPKPPAVKPVLALGDPRFRHPGALDYGVVGTDGKTLYTLSGNGEASAWDLETGVSRLLFADDRLRNSLALMPDGKQLVGISRDDVGVWDIASGKQVRKLDWSVSAMAAIPRPDGKAIVVFREDKIEEWPTAGGRREVAKTAQFYAPAVSPDGKWFAAAAAGQRPSEVIVYDAQQLTRRATLKTGDVGFGSRPNGLSRVRLAFAPDGRTVAAVAAGGGLAIWDLTSAAVAKELKPGLEKPGQGEDRLTVLRYSADGKTVFAGTEAGIIRRWDVVAGSELAPLRGHRTTVHALLLAKDGAWLVSFCRDGMVRRWDVATGKEVELPDGYTGYLYSAASPDGKAALLLDSTGRLDLWDLGTGKRRTAIRPAGPTRVDLDPPFGFVGDGSRVYFVDRPTGTLTIWTTDGKEGSRIQLPRALRYCVPAPDGKSFVVSRGFNRQARVDAVTGKDLWVTDEFFPKGITFPPAFTADGKVLVCGAVDYKAPPGSKVSGRLELVRLDAETGKVVARSDVETGTGGSTGWFHRPRFSADGKRMSLWYLSTELTIYDTTTWTLVRRQNFAGQALAPDGRWVADVLLDRLQGFDADTGKRRFEASMGRGGVLSLTVLPDSRRVLTSGTGGMAFLWDVSKELGK